VLLVALALAAAAGVAAVFIDARWVTLRVMWTGMLTAFVSALTLPLAKMTDRRRTRPAGLFGLSWLVLEYLLVVGLIWLERTLPGRMHEELAVTAWVFVLTGVAGILSLLLLPTAAGRWAGRLGLIVTGIATACFLIATWMPGRFWDNEEWWGTGWSIGGVGLLAAVTLLGLGTTRRGWRWVGIAFGAVGLGLALIEIWGTGLVDEELLCPPLSAALLVAFANAIFLVPLRAGQRWLPWAVLAVMTGTTIALNVSIVGNLTTSEALVNRICIAGAIVTGCGTMAIALLAIFNRRADVEGSSSVVMLLEIVCPRCRLSQSAPAGRSTCTGCGLRFDLRVEEPRCAECGYLLWGVTTERCPECGRAIAPSAGSEPAADATT
jgi:hypothetical protein